MQAAAQRGQPRAVRPVVQVGVRKVVQAHAPALVPRRLPRPHRRLLVRLRAQKQFAYCKYGWVVWRSSSAACPGRTGACSSACARNTEHLSGLGMEKKCSSMVYGQAQVAYRLPPRSSACARSTTPALS